MMELLGTREGRAWLKHKNERAEYEASDEALEEAGKERDQRRREAAKDPELWKKYIEETERKMGGLSERERREQFGDSREQWIK